MKRLLIAMLIAAAPVPGAFAGYAPKDAACAAEDMQILYYYFAAPGAKVLERTTTCHGDRTTLKMPEWLQKAVPGMMERKVWKDPEEGELSEAALWQTPASILYEFADTVNKGEDLLGKGKEYDDMRIRFAMSVDRLNRTGQEKALEGRGKAMLSVMNFIMEDFDGLTDPVVKADRQGFDAKAGDLLRRCRLLFAQVLDTSPVKIPAFKYSPEARVLPGYRGVSLPVSGAQSLFVAKGDRVDMLVTFEAIMANDVKEKVTATILQNVLVTGVKKAASPDGQGVVQLLCNPNEAQYAALSLAQASNIVLVRRAAGDFEMRPMEIASFRKLIK